MSAISKDEKQNTPRADHEAGEAGASIMPSLSSLAASMTNMFVGANEEYHIPVPLDPAEKRQSEIAAIEMLKTNPLTFLFQNAIVPGGSSGAGVKTFYMTFTGETISRPGDYLGSWSTDVGKKYKIRAGSELGGTPFQAMSIPVQPSNLPISAYPLPADPGVDIMITTQLQGCSVVMIPGANGWDVAHLQPTGETGEQLRNRLAGQGFRAYGRTDYADAGCAIFVGVKQNDQWSFYVQTIDAHFNVLGVQKLV